MTAKHVMFRSAAREKILHGASQLADAIRVTLGPKSKSVPIQKKWGAPLVCNNGVSWKIGSRSSSGAMREPADEAAPFLTLESLPATVAAGLPPHLQEHYVEAFNEAWSGHADFADREAFCHRVARSAVRRQQRSVAAPLSGKGVSTPPSRDTDR